MYTHTVQFNFKDTADAGRQQAFFTALLALKSIDGVNNFTLVKQVSPRNTFINGVYMTFEDGDAFQFYNKHPEHLAFIQAHWLPGVESYLESDFVAA